ncbi:hypothetical protein [Lutibacter sp. B1]|uniref:hypothetical protein n=1 Tax=Lutibacter sp. B1 TaxID=2725996 RepID=UPI0014564881|nr:hypothetical protein [Lutibacter sp. B1]NLP56681.1 hypothetical protein [Lutibacter sp. B1]
MKTNSKLNNRIKLGVFALFMLAFSFANAQATADVAKGSTAVKVIDNKGTIKYFQSNNGITQIVNSTDDVTTTTWQLGGTLTDDTYIDASGAVFAITGISETALTAATAVDGTGFTLLVRDETSGEIQKMLATDLITSGQTVFTVATTGDDTFDVASGTPAMSGAQIPLPEYSKVWVYRNGAKLIANVDYTISGSVVTINVTADLPNYAGDIIEIQYIK